MPDPVPYAHEGAPAPSDTRSPGRSTLGMSFIRENAAAYIRLVHGTSHDSWPLDQTAAPFDVVVDVDVRGRVLGVELLGRPGDGPASFLGAIGDGTVADVLAAEGFEVPQLRGGPEISVELL